MLEPRAKFALLILYVLCSLLTRAVLLPVEVFDMDEAANIVGSWELLRGKLLYTDFVDNKPPLLYVYYALAQLIFGKGLFAVHLFSTLFTIPLTAFGVSAFFKHNRAGIVAAITYLVYSASFLAHDMHASNTEIPMMLPGTWAIVLLSQPEDALRAGRIAAASFLIGIGLLLKYQIVFWLGSIWLGIIYQCIPSRSFGRMALLIVLSAASFAIPPLLTYYAFAAAGGEKWMLYWTILNNLYYSANPITAQEAIGRAASYFLPFLIVTSPLWWFSFQSIRMMESRYQKLLIGSLILLSIPPALIGFRFFPHYFVQLYVPLAIGSGPYLAQLLKAPWSGTAKAFLAYTLFLWIGFTIANVILYYGNSRVYRETDPVFPKVGQYLKSDPCYQKGTLFVWGYAPMFYYYAGLPTASRFVVLSQSHLTGYISGNLESIDGAMATQKKIKSEQWDLLIQDLEKNEATYILDTAPAGIYRWNHYPVRDYPRLQEYLDRKYKSIDTVEGVVVYRRKGCKNPSQQ